jgi:phosphate transport system permease protein
MNALFYSFCFVSSFIGFFIVLNILISLLKHGLPGLSLNFFTESTPSPHSLDGGILNSLVGSLIINMAAIAISSIIGLSVATFLSEFTKSHFLISFIKFINEIFLSTPSILIGLFVYSFVVLSLKSYSGFSGSIALSLIAFPIIFRISFEMMSLVPLQIKEAALSLGIPKWRYTVFILWRMSKGGIFMGILLALARISGETAPLLFTALNNQFLSLNFLEPMANLPVTIYQFAMSPYENWQQIAWAAALFITLSLVGLNLALKKLIQNK